MHMYVHACYIFMLHMLVKYLYKILHMPECCQPRCPARNEMYIYITTHVHDITCRFDMCITPTETVNTYSRKFPTRVRVFAPKRLQSASAPINKLLLPGRLGDRLDKEIGNILVPTPQEKEDVFVPTPMHA